MAPLIQSRTVRNIAFDIQKKIADEISEFADDPTRILLSPTRAHAGRIAGLRSKKVATIEINMILFLSVLVQEHNYAVLNFRSFSPVCICITGWRLWGQWWCSRRGDWPRGREEDNVCARNSTGT